MYMQRNLITTSCFHTFDLFSSSLALVVCYFISWFVSQRDYWCPMTPHVHLLQSRSLSSKWNRSFLAYQPTWRSWRWWQRKGILAWYTVTHEQSVLQPGNSEDTFTTDITWSEDGPQEDENHNNSDNNNTSKMVEPVSLEKTWITPVLEATEEFLKTAFTCSGEWAM